MDKAEIESKRRKLKFLKEERKELIELYGNKGQKHPSARMIGGLNPAALKLYVVRNEIAVLEKELRPKKSGNQIINIVPKGNYKITTRNLPQGLLFDVYTDKFIAKIGKDNIGKFYIVKDNKFVDGNFKTISEAKKKILTLKP